MTRWLRRMSAEEKLQWWNVAAGPLDGAVAAWGRETALGVPVRQHRDVEQARPARAGGPTAASRNAQPQSQDNIS
jgi:hypothetical protein